MVLSKCSSHDISGLAEFGFTPGMRALLKSMGLSLETSCMLSKAQRFTLEGELSSKALRTWAFQIA